MFTNEYNFNEWVKNQKNILEAHIIYNDKKQLRHCNAYIIPCEFVYLNYEVYYGYVLMSYNTIVSVSHHRGEAERLGKWSRTTSRQQTWFERWLAI